MTAGNRMIALLILTSKFEITRTPTNDTSQSRVSSESRIRAKFAHEGSG